MLWGNEIIVWCLSAMHHAHRLVKKAASTSTSSSFPFTVLCAVRCMQRLTEVDFCFVLCLCIYLRQPADEPPFLYLQSIYTDCIV